MLLVTEPAEGRLSRPYEEVVGTGGLQELSARVKKQYGIQEELTGSKVRVVTAAGELQPLTRATQPRAGSAWLGLALETPAGLG